MDNFFLIFLMLYYIIELLKERLEKMNKRLEAKIVQAAKDLNSQVKMDYSVFPLERIFTGNEIFNYVAAAKLGILDEYKEIVETGVIKTNKYHSASILSNILNENAICQLVNEEFSELFPNDVFVWNENEHYLEFNPNNSENIKKTELITWLRTQKNFFKNGAIYGLLVKFNYTIANVKIKF